jgi:hypothetical protein
MPLSFLHKTAAATAKHTTGGDMEKRQTIRRTAREETALIIEARKGFNGKVTNLLTGPRGNPKTMKGESQGYATFVLHLAPASLSGYNLCPCATAGCRFACLNTAGRGGMLKTLERERGFNAIQIARVRKALWLMERRPEFMAQLVREVTNAIAWAAKHDLTAVFRLNATSDVRWENLPVVRGGVEYANIFEAFATTTFYDYTKIPNRRVAGIPNYSLTFSLADGNAHHATMALAAGLNVAAVFHTVPETFMGHPVINGDATDLRFLDPRGVIVGLKAKGKARKDSSGFVQHPMALPVLRVA